MLFQGLECIDCAVFVRDKRLFEVSKMNYIDCFLVSCYLTLSDVRATSHWLLVSIIWMIEVGCKQLIRL